jgi:Ca2+-binding RTX toxin-like protein
VHTGDAAGDTFISIEKFRGTLHNDTFVADDNATLFEGYGGTLNTVDYSTSTSGVQVDLVAGTGTGGDAQGDSYASIHRIIGSGFADTLTALSGELVGGDGNDIYYISQTATITELANEGIDEVRTSLLTYTLGNHLDNLTYTGASNFVGNGNSLNNVITSGAGNDTLTAGDGNDTIVGNDGADAINGGNGSDTSVYSGSYEGVNVDLANNTAVGGHAIGDVLTSIENLVGSQYADNLLGSASDNLLNGQNGNDTLDGRDGDDILIGGAGTDILIGGSGTDVASYITASSGVTINLETGTHLGDAAGDTFSGIERFVGSDHADTFVADIAANNFDGGLGVDTVNYNASTGAVTVNLSTGVNTGGSAAGDILKSIERVIGSAFNDHLTASAGGQTLQGGAGDDIYVVNSASVTVTEAASAGNDTVFTSLASYSLPSNIETLSYTGTGNFTGTGNSSNNTIIGGIGNDTLRGGGGADHLVGGSGTDTASYSTAAAGVAIDFVSNTHTGDATGDVFDSIEVFQGSNHADTFIDGGAARNFRGGSGNDTYVITSGSTVITELSGGGTDTIQTSLSAYTLGAQMENLTYVGGSSFNGSGNSLNNVLIGNVGNDTLNGQGGADTLGGGGGADTFVFDNAAETTTLGVGDLIQDFSQAEGDVIDLSQIGVSNLIGTAAFSSMAGELRYEINGGLTTVAGDLDGDGNADFHLDLTGSINLTAADFLL